MLVREGSKMMWPLQHPALAQAACAPVSCETFTVRRAKANRWDRDDLALQHMQLLPPHPCQEN